METKSLRTDAASRRIVGLKLQIFLVSCRGAAEEASIFISLGEINENVSSRGRQSVRAGQNNQRGFYVAPSHVHSTKVKDRVCIIWILLDRNFEDCLCAVQMTSVERREAKIVENLDVRGVCV